VGIDIPIHLFLHFMNVEQRRPMRMLLEVITDDVLHNHFATIKVGEPDRVSERHVGVRRKICRKQNLFKSYHVVLSLFRASVSLQLFTTWKCDLKLSLKLCSPAHSLLAAILLSRGDDFQIEPFVVHSRPMR
jgi:hypothetical protein